MRRRIASRGTVLTIGLLVAGVAASEDLYVAGPIDAIDSARAQLSVLGQSVAVTRTQLRRVLATKVDAAGSQLQVIASGPRHEGGLVAQKLVVLAEPYVPGASSVAILGFISKVDASIGRASIGKLTIDLSSIAQGVHVGDLVEFAGSQPMPGGALMATEVRLTTNGSIGSGAAGSIGSGAAGSIGSGAAGSIGSGAAGSIGSGAAGSIGSGAAGSIGSGAAGSIGSGAAGSIGSGAAGSIGSGAAGSIGSGAAGSIGSGAAGSIGSGAAGSIGSGSH